MKLQKMVYPPKVFDHGILISALDGSVIMALDHDMQVYEFPANSILLYGFGGYDFDRDHATIMVFLHEGALWCVPVDGIDLSSIVSLCAQGMSIYTAVMVGLV
jgi:hypothetical protein